jgi:hypothetical protein
MYSVIVHSLGRLWYGHALCSIEVALQLDYEGLYLPVYSVIKLMKTFQTIFVLHFGPTVLVPSHILPLRTSRIVMCAYTTWIQLENILPIAKSFRSAKLTLPSSTKTLSMS